MRIRYTRYDGTLFQFQADLDLGSVYDFVLAHGEDALRALQALERHPQHSALLKQLLDQGLLEKARGRFRLTPRAASAMQRKALMEIFAHLKTGARDGHATLDRGGAGERLEGTAPFEFGDPVAEIDLSATLGNALRRAADGPRPPIRLRYADIERFESEGRASCSTVVLLDQSGSMARFGRFFHAKKCAMALIALIRQRFPYDTVDLVGFHSGAQQVPEERLPLLMPKPVTTYDPVIRLRVPVNRLDQAPPHFTNLHMGLMIARRLLARRSGDNRMIFIITDGQPTAHVQGDAVHLLYPPDRRSHVATLTEAYHVARGGVRICTFALTDDYWDMDWLGFVDELGRLTRGVTFHCASGELGACVMESYLSGRRRKAYLA
ncbi:MAG: VWA domain-containing protein [Phycisphaerae bacterium]|nr:VWA domain-containing protein [Phycisphaerae bacterium]MCZ2399937.1 VWA domain-containing protein [Phycisphaerae bacterium]NUQ49002.1 VWA domain-containing protein [Phycisphaerae bacterium]